MNGQCAQCQGPKIGYYAKVCRTCYLALPSRRCPDCGKKLTSSHSSRCQACWDAIRPRAGHVSTPKGWEVDEMAVERLMWGYPVNANPSERRLATKELERYGLTAVQIAERLRVTPRSVERYRATLKRAS